MDYLACDGAMFGSWWHTLYYDKKKRCIVTIIADPEAEEGSGDWENPNEGFIKKTLSGQEIAEAIAKAIDCGWDRCYPNNALAEFAATGDWGGGYDSVVADGVLQYAIFGDIIYG
jgi:hypothetical protein